MRQGTHKNKELVVSMFLILTEVIRYLKDPGMYKSNVIHKMSWE